MEDWKVINLIRPEGKTVMISNRDYERVNQYRWFCDNGKRIASQIEGKTVSLGRFIMQVTNPLTKVNIINHDIYDHRRENLRITDAKGRANNQPIRKDKQSSKYYGVYGKANKYICIITRNKQRKNLGRFESEIDAAVEHDLYCVCILNETFNLNFPDRLEEYLSKKATYQPRERLKKSKYRCISFENNTWRARIELNNKTISILTTSDEIEAAKAVDQYIVDHNLVGRKLNFPELFPDYGKIKKIKTGCIIVDEKTVQLIIKGKEQKVLIDKEDYDRVKYWKCHLKIYRGISQVTITVDRNVIALARYILNITDPLVIADHISGNTCDNRKMNLRPSSHLKNGQNKSKIKTKETTSKYIGVSKAKNRFRACIAASGTLIYSESFPNEESAARARDIFIITKLPDSHYKLNFTWTDEDIALWKQKLE